MSAKTSILLACAMLTACSSMTEPEDIAVAEDFCAKRGGYTHVARYQRGKQLLINCKDGTHIDVLLGDRT
jgi:hypothetical protein